MESTTSLMPVGISVPAASTGTIMILSLTCLVSTTSDRVTEYASIVQQLLPTLELALTSVSAGPTFSSPEVAR
jgi:hypothetical protein